MASITKQKSGWRAFIRRQGFPSKSSIFLTKKEAELWAAQEEAKMLGSRRGEIPRDKTFGDLLRRYLTEVTPLKRGDVRESVTLRAMLGEGRSGVPLPVCKVKLTDLNETHVAAWRDARLAQVSASSVVREWNILSSAATRALKEWKWLHDNPFRNVTRPGVARARTRRPTQAEIDALLLVLGCDPQITPVTMNQRLGFAILFAVETGMRAGEICGLTRADVTGAVAHLDMTKNGYSRDVPLTVEACRLLAMIPRGALDAPIFQTTPARLDALFRKARGKAGIADLHFHDLRREALSRLSQKLDPMTLAKVSGHRDLRVLLNTYYAPSMADVATRIG